MTTSNAIAIRDRIVGPGHPPYVIAEMSANHQQDLRRAIDIVHAAKAAGADAVKLQTYTPDTMTLSSDQAPFRIGEGTVWAGRSLYDLYAEAMTPWEWHAELVELGGHLDIDVFSTPFDDTAVAFLEDLDVPAYKVASFEVVDLPLVRRMAKTGRPLIISTGMAALQEIDRAVNAARDAGAVGIALLRCNSAYPADTREMDLATIPHMAATWNVPIGLSDHTLDNVAAIVATTLGACIFEKHITLSRDDGGPDSSFSLEPDEFREFVNAIHESAAAIGGVRYGPSASEEPSLAFRRSLFVVADIEAGQEFTRANVRSIRPAGGLDPDEIDRVLGRRAARPIARGTPLTWEAVGG